MKKQKNNIAFNICYYIGKQLAFMILALYLVKAYIPNDFIELILIVLLDWFILKFAIIDSLENDNGFIIRKSELDPYFIPFTTLGLIILSFIFHYSWWIIVALSLFNALAFNAMDANQEKKISQANKAMRAYLSKHKIKK